MYPSIKWRSSLFSDLIYSSLNIVFDKFFIKYKNNLMDSFGWCRTGGVGGGYS